jgi:antitoxin YefM
METIFRLKASEIDSKFLAMLKKLFSKREIEITVTDVINDETEFLLNDPKNHAHLLEAIDEVKHNKKLVRFTGDEFKKYSKSLLKK